MKKLIIIGLVLLVFVSCSVSKKEIQEINRRLNSHEEKIAILTEQIMLLDFESIRQASNQTQNQRREFIPPTSTQNIQTPPQQTQNTTSTGRGRTEAEIHIIYEEGLRQYHNRDFAAAIRSFNIITNQAPTHDLVSNAYYWIGESYYAMGDFSAARLSFQVIIDRYQNSNKYWDSQVKIAMTWMRQNRGEQARAILEAIRRDNPNYERMDLVEQNLRQISVRQ